MELWQELEQKIKELDVSVKNLRISGANYAKAYRNYRMLLSKELLMLRDEGVPATTAYDIARGNEKVANAKFDEICMEAVYKANQESINAIKVEIKILQEQQKQDWGMAGKGEY